MTHPEKILEQFNNHEHTIRLIAKDLKEAGPKARGLVFLIQKDIQLDVPLEQLLNSDNEYGLHIRRFDIIGSTAQLYLQINDLMMDEYARIDYNLDPLGNPNYAGTFDHHWGG